MHRASIHLPAGQWPQEKAAGSLTLDFDERHRRRFRLTADQGDDILLDLPRAIAMADGDGFWPLPKSLSKSDIKILHS